MRGGYAFFEPAVCWVASALPSDWEGKVIDGDILSDADIMKIVSEFLPQVVGFSVFTAGYDRALKIAQQLKDASPCVSIVFGGWHPSLMPEEVSREAVVDVVVVGKGENVIEKILSTGIPSHDKKIIRAADYPEKDCWPARDSLDMSALQWTGVGVPPLGAQRMASIRASEGCPGHCSYCCTPVVYPNGHRIGRSVSDVIDEISYVIERYRVNLIFFRDENLTANPIFLEKVCHSLISSGINKLVDICSFAHVNYINLALVKLMAQAGWMSILYGVESFDRNWLVKMNRGATFSQIDKAFKWTREAGIFATASTMVQQPEDLDEILKGFKRIRPDEAYIFFFQPFRGTPAYEEYKGYLREDVSYDDYYILRPLLEYGSVVGVAEFVERRNQTLQAYYQSGEYKSLKEFHRGQLGSERFESLTTAFRQRLRMRGIII